MPNGFKDASNDPATIEEWWRQEPDANIGVATGQSGLTVLDVDGPEGKAQLKHEGGTLSPTLVSRTGREDGYHLWYRGAVPSSQVKGEHLDVRGTTGYVVAPGSVHATGRLYHWANPECPIADVPDWVETWVASRGGKAARPTESLSDFPNLGDRPSYLGGVETPSLADRALAGFHEPWSAHAEARLRSALAAIPADIDGKTWHSFGAAIHDLQWPRGLDIWNDWSKLSTGRGKGNGEYRGGQDLERRWVGFGKAYTGPRVTIGSIFHMAKRHGWVDAAEPKIDRPADSSDRSGEQGDQQKDQVKGWRSAAFSAAELRMMTFEPVRYVLPRFIPEGMTLLVGRPKVGKSWWVLDLCLACAAGLPALGTLQPIQGNVLYLALEDGKRRLQRRLDKLLPTFSGEWPAQLTLVPMGGWRRADQGGLEDIEEWCKSVAKPVLVVVDTLERIRKPANGKSPLYSADYEAITGLQKIAIAYGIALVVLHHDRKSDADDAFDTVSGTLGLTGAADTILIIKRQSNGVVLYARGRDIEESETAMQFDKATCRWNILGAASEVLRSNERARIIFALRAAGKPLSVREIMIDAEMQSRNAMDILLGKMARDGEIRRVERGRYDLSPNHRTDQTERKNA